MQLRGIWGHARPILGLLAILGVLLMGAYPAALAGIDQAENPAGAIGSPITCNGITVGSSLSAQNISSPLFFEPRNASASASGVDPDITPSEAYDQVPSVANATGIPPSSLDYLVQQNINTNEAQNWVFSPPYVDVNALNLELIHLYPQVYAGYCT